MPNIIRVSDALYRSAQPTRAGFRAAQQMGVRSVVNLRRLWTDMPALQGSDLAYFHFGAWPWHPEIEDYLRFLRVVLEPDLQPVLVHCRQGQDRTGVACAIYRMVLDGWSADRAIAEMQASGWNRIWAWLPAWLRALRPVEVYARAVELPLPREAIW